MVNECPSCETAIPPCRIQQHIIDCVMARQAREAKFEQDVLRKEEEQRIWDVLERRRKYLRAEGFQV